MEILTLLIIVCVALIIGAVAFFAWTVRQGTFDHADRLALLPLDDEGAPPEHATKEGEDGNATDRLQR
ncbi:MAG: cbb3-type cytochrome oxidase assembly protein CcoS [Myxococcota bacterium]